MGRKPQSLDSIVQKIDFAGPSGCWLWLGPNRNYNHAGKDYGCLTYKNKTYTAHRFIYELVVEKIPTGMELDHICCVKLCVNPDHLQIVTHRENIQAKFDDYCIRGHKLDYVRPDGRRGCRTCRNIASRESKQRARSKLQFITPATGR